MSIKVKEWLKQLGIETTHEERVEIDREIEILTRRPCDESVSQLNEREFLEIVDKVRRRKRKSDERTPILAEALA